MLIRALVPLAVAALCGATLYQIARPSVPRLIYNPSDSAPVGWYRLHSYQAVGRNDFVAAYVPVDAASLAVERQYLPSGIPLIKTVWATTGETVCHRDGMVEIAGREPLAVLAQDSMGRPLPSRQGCYTLSKDEVFLVSTDVQTSFDSRYFGPVRREQILGRVEYLGRLRGRSERMGSGRKAGRG